MGIAGHRTTYGAPFWDLNELDPGDRIVLATEYGVFNYRVTGSSIIDPSDGSVLDATEHPTLVLTTVQSPVLGRGAARRLRRPREPALALARPPGCGRDR